MAASPMSRGDQKLSESESPLFRSGRPSEFQSTVVHRLESTTTTTTTTMKVIESEDPVRGSGRQPPLQEEWRIKQRRKEKGCRIKIQESESESCRAGRKFAMALAEMSND